MALGYKSLIKICMYVDMYHIKNIYSLSLREQYYQRITNYFAQIVYHSFSLDFFNLRFNWKMSTYS